MNTIELKLRITNTYADGEYDHIGVYIVPEPSVADAREDYEEWSMDYLFPLTGEGRSGDAIYEVEVLSSPLADLTWRHFEWGG